MNALESLLAISLGILTFTGTVSADAKVEEQDIGPVAPDDQYVVSPHGGHVATIAHKGSRMGDKYQRQMNRDEEYYYASDFGPRFRDDIAQPHSTNPAWNRLHPTVEDCRQ